MRNKEDSIGSLMMLKMFMRKLQKIVNASRGIVVTGVESGDEAEAKQTIPKDVKKGHFAVTAVKGGKSERFVLEISCLSNPAFKELLGQAELEYGFQQKGVLEVPCQPEEIQNIVNQRRKRRASTEW